MKITADSLDEYFLTFLMVLQYEEDRVVVAKLSPDDTVTMEVVMATIDMRDCKMGFGENEDVEKLQEILSDNLALEWIIKGEDCTHDITNK